MKRRLGTLGIAAILALMGCAPGVTYYKVALGQASVLSGEDCPGNLAETITISGVDRDGTVALYGEPNSNYYIDLGGPIVNVAGPTGLDGVLQSGVYNFTGSWMETVEGSPEIQTTVNIGLTMTPSGPGATGTLSLEFICKGSGTKCGVGNPLDKVYAIHSTDSNDFDCKETVSVLATQVSGPTEISPTSASSSSADAGN
jgi:hypothetical protein